MKKSALSLTRGFTLVELLVVIAIIAILAAVVVLIINPIELTKRGRDATRLSDLVNLQNAINVAVQEATGSSTEKLLCVGSTTGTGWNCVGRSSTGTQATDGSGWVKVNLGAQASVSVPTLPRDPINDDTNHYTYCAANDGWEINTALESLQQTTAPNDRRANDGGNDLTLYEVGSNLALIATSGGSCTYN